MTTTQDDLRDSDLVDEKLYGLVEIAEQQQATAHMILEQLASERNALAEERDRWVNIVERMRDDIDATVHDAIASNMARVVNAASETINGLGRPVAEQMEEAATSAERAERAFRNMIGWATTRLLLWGLGALAGLMLLGWLASGIVLWWDTRAIAAAHVAKQQLQLEVAELRANSDAWIKSGMATKLRRCGPKKRWCIAVDEAAGAFGEQSDYRLVKGF
jgi:hypothetical protein